MEFAEEEQIFRGRFEQLKGGPAYAHPAVDFLKLKFALMFWPKEWKQFFFVELFGSFRLRKPVEFKSLGVFIDGRREFGPSNFGARWFYPTRVAVESRDLDGLLDGIGRLERAIGVLHIASTQFLRNCGPGAAIQYRCRFFEFEIWNPGSTPDQDHVPDLTGGASQASAIFAELNAIAGRAGILVWRAVWWIRHARNDRFTGEQVPSMFFIYLSYWNALECLIQAVEAIKPPPKPTSSEKNGDVRAFFAKRNSVPTAQDVEACFREVINPGIKKRARYAFDFAARAFPQFSADHAYRCCFERKPIGERLYAVRNDIDHGNIVEYDLPARQRVQKSLGELSSIVLAFLRGIALGAADGER